MLTLCCWCCQFWQHFVSHFALPFEKYYQQGCSHCCDNDGETQSQKHWQAKVDLSELLAWCQIRQENDKFSSRITWNFVYLQARKWIIYTNGHTFNILLFPSRLPEHTSVDIHQGISKKMIVELITAIDSLTFRRWSLPPACNDLNPIYLFIQKT